MMLERRQPVVYQWEGAVPLHEIPTEVLYGVRLVFAQGGGADDATLRAALGSLGPVRLWRLPVLGTRIRIADALHPLSARVRRGRMEVRFQHRVKGRALARVVAAFASIPGASDLTIWGESPRFDPAYSDLRPCTTCAARNFPPSPR